MRVKKGYHLDRPRLKFAFFWLANKDVMLVTGELINNKII